jgi:hypothetical protein
MGLSPSICFLLLADIDERQIAIALSDGGDSSRVIQGGICWWLEASAVEANCRFSSALLGVGSSFAALCAFVRDDQLLGECGEFVW